MKNFQIYPRAISIPRSLISKAAAAIGTGFSRFNSPKAPSFSPTHTLGFPPYVKLNALGFLGNNFDFVSALYIYIYIAIVDGESNHLLVCLCPRYHASI